MRRLGRYTVVGAANTLIHIAVFSLSIQMGTSAMLANLAAFLAAASFGFIANAKWTFAKPAGVKRYLLFVGMMGAVAAGSGKLADGLSWHPVSALVVFAALSWVCGYLGSRFIVFR